MTICVIDDFQAIDIHHADRNDFAGFLRLAQQPGKSLFARPAVEQVRQLVIAGRLGEQFTFGDVHRLRKMPDPAIDPSHQAVVIFVNPPGYGIGFLPDQGFLPAHELLHRAECTAMGHSLLQRFPTGLFFRLLQMKGFFHCFIHKQYLIGIHIGDVDIDAHIIHHFIEHPVLQRIIP